MIVADESARVLSLGVEDLLDAGEHGAAEAGESLRAVHAARVEHLARAAAAGARCEVALDVPVTWREWTIHLSGRADVLRDDARGISLEVLRDVGDSGAARALERAGFLALFASYAGEPVARVAVLELRPGEPPLRSDVVFKREAWEDLLRVRLDELAHRAELELGRARERRRVDVPFPFESPRPVQETLLREVAGAAASGLVLLVSAPTGVGKTAGALYPFLRDALAHDRRVFFVTSRGSQQELALETLRRMLPAGGPALAMQISAKERVCPQAQLGCVERRCPWGRRFAERLARTGLLDELETRGVVSAEQVAVAARAHELCPFEVTLRLAQRASAVVCDFNYVFDPRVALRHLLGEGDARALLVVDEAHDLPERARGALSPVLELEQLESLGRCLELQVEPAYQRAGELLREVASHAGALAARLGEERESLAPWVEPPARGFWEPIALRAMVSQMETQALIAHAAPRDARLLPRREGRDARLRDPVQSALADLRDFAVAADGDPDRFAAIWSPERAALFCLDPAPWIGARIKSFHAAVLMSATLAPLEHHARLLGIDGPRSLSLDLPCPFPRENRLLLAATGVDTRFKVRSEQAAEIARTIARCAATRRGNWLAFFSSFAFRDEVVAKLPAGALRVLLQLPGAPVEPIFARLRANKGETLLVCGVHGGVLAEGVDYPGELAIGVFVVGPGLPKVELERELVRAHFDEQLGAGFEYAYLVPGLARSVQAGGRVLRGPDDVGAIVLLDRRFGEPDYFDRLPAWWRDEMVLTDDPARALEAFWQSGGRARL
ncbi:MAG TPA: ATP-dependent DNA helicase [Myxococcota bacterium]|nr:ATP-dependent DNA helicase [Myxococcota bacterium]